MDLVLDGANLERVGAHGASAYPLEACGVMLGREGDGRITVSRVVPSPNAADPSERGRRFLIDPRAVLNLIRAVRGTEESVVGFYHSHPDADAEPSGTDMEFIRLWPKTAWVIVPVERGTAGAPRAWWLEDADTAAPSELTLSNRSPVPAGCPD